MNLQILGNIRKLTFDGDTTGSLDKDVEQSFRLIWWLGSGTNYSSGTTPSTWEAATATNHAVGNVNLADSNSNEFYITGIQMETGSVATPSSTEAYGDEALLGVRDICIEFKVEVVMEES